MPVVPPLRVALLHLTLRPCPRLATVPFISTRTLRTMATQPSLQAANDFLSFVNNSPTRMPAPHSPQRERDIPELPY
jgi:hypothetical protein